MRPRAKELIGLTYWPMRGVSRVLYGKQKPLGGVRVGFPPCWTADEDGRHCRKPKGHAGVCAFW